MLAGVQATLVELTAKVCALPAICNGAVGEQRGKTNDIDVAAPDGRVG